VGPTSFSKNRDRLLEGDIAAKFLVAVTQHPKVKRLLSSEHFSVDGTLIEAWASIKSFHSKDGSGEPPAPGRNGERDFHGEKRTNDTHESTTDPDARLYRKASGQPARLCFMGHALMENRNGLVVDACITRADRPGRITLGADRGYDAQDFVNELRTMNVAPHVAARAKGSAVDGRTIRHLGYKASQIVRKRIEEAFGWAKYSARMGRTKHRGLARGGWQFTLAMAAYNLVRLPKLLAAVPV
jgi:hypothetical protein